MIQQHHGLYWHFFEPNQLGLYAIPAGNGEFSPITASRVLQDVPDAEAVLDGPMFSNCDPDGRGYSASTCGNPGYLSRDSRISLNEPSDHGARGGTLSVVANEAAFHPRAEAPASAHVAIQGYPTLVVRGQPTQGLVDLDTRWRCALAKMSDGRMAFVCGAMSMPLFAQKLAESGVSDAVYTDGGGSARLATRDGQWAGDSENRPVPLWIVAYRRDSARVQGGMPAAGWVLLSLSVALGVAGGAAALYAHGTRSRRPRRG